MFIKILMFLLFLVVLGGINAGILFDLLFCLFVFCYLFFNYSGGLAIFFFYVVDKVSFLLFSLTLWSGLMLLVLCFKYGLVLKSFVFLKMVTLSLFTFLLVSFMLLTLLGFYIFFEFSLLPLLIMIMMWGYQIERVQASFYLFFYTMLGSLPFLLVLIYLIEMDKNLSWFFFLFNKEMSWEGWLVAVFSFFAFFIKVPVYGLHLWLPKAHVEAPVGGSMILAAVLLKLGGYGIIRVFSGFFFLKQSYLLVGGYCLWGALLAAVVCAMQSDMKALIAYSSVSHMGVCILFLLALNSLSYKATLIILLSHGFCSSALFFTVNFFYERVGSRQIFVNRGSFNFFFFFSCFFMLFLAINFGVPPFLNLMGELYGFMSVGSVFFFLLLLGVVGFLVAYYCLFLYSSVIHGHSHKHLSNCVEIDSLFFMLFLHIFPLLSLILKLDLF